MYGRVGVIFSEDNVKESTSPSPLRVVVWGITPNTIIQIYKIYRSNTIFINKKIMEFNTELKKEDYLYRYNNTLSNKNKRGLDIVGKALKKKYPFLTGNISLWKNTQNLYSSIPVELEMDFNMFIDYVGGDQIQIYNNSFGNLSTIVIHDNNQDVIDHASSIDTKIKKDINKYYHHLPEDFQVHYQLKFDWKDEFNTYPAELYIMNFINI
jgi:hypothetical protein